MTGFQSILNDMLFWTEGIVAFMAIIFYRTVKKEFWRYFVFYLVLIFLFEITGRWGSERLFISKVQFYNYLVIPFQFIFFYWLYAARSLNKKPLFYCLALLYVLSFIPSELFFSESKIIYSFNYTFGCILLMLLVVLEYYQQVNSNDILKFYSNRMFYINLGVTIFYIGTLPFMTFYLDLRDYEALWNIYYIYFMISCIVMYLLFLISFIWGKQSSSSQ